MQRVHANGQWSLFCPNEAPGLADVWGEEFEALYTKYEKAVGEKYYLRLTNDACLIRGSEVFLLSTQGKAKTVVQAQNLWFEILKSQIETGTPYMLFKVIYFKEISM